MASITTANRNRAADPVAARCNSGLLRVYSGTPPADANAALSGNTLLAELTFGATAFGAAVAGVATANAITQDASADATGSPSFARAFETGGTTVVFQMFAACPWVASSAYSIGDRVVNGGNQYRCTASGTSAGSGGPSGTGASIVDGGATWAFEAPAEMTITLPAGASRIVQFGAVSCSSLTYTQAGG